MFATTRRWQLLVLLCLPWSLAYGEGSEGEAARWLVKMSEASRSLNYDGTFVYVHDGNVETMRVIHKADNGREQERLISLNGSNREVIRNDDVVTCLLPNNKRVVVDKTNTVHGFPPGFSDAIEEVVKYYEFTLEGDGRVAGHPAQIIRIASKDPYRYGYRLWLDKKTGLLLKSELVSGDGEPIEQMVFTSLEVLSSVPAALLKPQVQTDDSVVIGEEAGDRLPVDKGWQLAWLPEGFRISEHYKRKLSTTGAPVDHMILTDGFTMVSIFIESIDAKRGGKPGAAHKGAINAYSAIVANHKVTAVGEVPAATVHRIANAMEYRPIANLAQ